MDLWRAASANNAHWCDLAARSHGLKTEFTGQAWTCQQRTPPFYPDAVTLTPHLPTGELLARIDTSAGCSVKDSFAAVDLHPPGFRIWFWATWIARPHTPPVAAPRRLRWRRIGQPEDLARWQQARPDPTEPTDLFRASLLSHDQVAVLAAEHDSQILAGAVLTASHGSPACPTCLPAPAPGPIRGQAASRWPAHCSPGTPWSATHPQTTSRTPTSKASGPSDASRYGPANSAHPADDTTSHTRPHIQPPQPG